MSYLYLYKNSVIHKDQPSGIRCWFYWKFVTSISEELAISIFMVAQDVDGFVFKKTISFVSTTVKISNHTIFTMKAIIILQPNKMHHLWVVPNTVWSHFAMVRFMTIHFYNPCQAGLSTPNWWCITVATQASFLHLVRF
jgi:hypothetical protein